MRKQVGVVWLVTLAACGGMYQAAGLDPAAPSSMTIPIGIQGTDAVPALVARAARAGYSVASSGPALVTIGPVSIKEDPSVRLAFNVAVVADSAIIRGQLTDPMRQLRDYPIRAGTSGRAGWGWRELTRLADALKP